MSWLRSLPVNIAGEIEQVPTVADLPPTTLVPEGSVRYAEDTDLIYVNTSAGWTQVGGGTGTITGGQNVGGGAGIFKDVSGTDLRFKSLISSDSSIGLGVGADTIDITLVAPVPISKGGTGQSNQQAALNNLTDIGSHSNGDILQLLSGNAQFAPYTAPGTTGTANTPAYYDPSGNLMAMPQWSVNATRQSLSYYANTIAEAGGVNLFDISGQLQNTPDIVNNDLNVYNTSISNAGQINGTFRFINSYSLGSGTIQDAVMASFVMQNDSVANNFTMINLQENFNTVGGYLNGVSVGSSSATTFNKSGYQVNFSGSSGQDVFSFQSSYSGLAVTNSVNILNHFSNNTSTVGTSFNFASITNQGTVGQNLNGLFLNSQGVVTKGLSLIGLDVSANVGDGSGVSLGGLNMNIQNTAIVAGSIYGLNINNGAAFTGAGNQIQAASLNNQAVGDSVRAFNVYNNANMAEEFNGYRVTNDSANSRTATGVDITMSGNATDDAQGLRINVSNQTSTNNRVRSLDAQGATYSFNNSYRPASGLFVDSGNNNFTEYRIANGSPVTNTDVLANNNIVAYLAEDNQALGPVGLGIATLNSISLLGIATTKQIDLIRGLIVVASIQNPGYADAGVLDKFQGVVYAGALAGGGSTVVNEAIGLYMPSTFDSYATANWGIRVEGATADNYVNKLAVGTGDFKTDAGYLVEVAGKVKTDDNIETAGDVKITAAGKGLQVAEGSNAKMGVATLVSGTATVSTTAVTANSRIFLTNQSASGTIGVTYIANKIAGTSFDIVSTDAGETSDIAWMIVEAV